MVSRIKRRLALQQRARLIRRAHGVLASLNAAMARDGLSRQERRRIWRDVYKGHTDAAELLEGMSQ